MGFFSSLSHFVSHQESSLFSRIVRYSNRKSNEYSTDIFIQDYSWTLSIHCYSLLFSSPVRNLNCESNEYGTNIFIQHDLWSLSIHSYSSLFSCSVRYSNRKSNEYCTNIFIQDDLWSLSIHSYSCCSAGQFVIQIVNCKNIVQIKLYCIIYNVCLFTLTVDI